MRVILNRHVPYRDREGNQDESLGGGITEGSAAISFAFRDTSDSGNEYVCNVILRTQIYTIYADYFAHVGRVFSATNADLRRSDRADGKYKQSYNTTSF